MRTDHVGLTVSDLPAMTQWYADALAMDVELEFTLEHVALDGVLLRSRPQGVREPHRVELLHRPGAVVGPRPEGPLEAALVCGLSHVAFDVPEVDAAYDALVAAGAGERMSPRASPQAGVRMAYVADPEGNLIELLDRTAAVSR